MNVIEREKLERFIDDLYEQYQREEEQAILQRNMDKAVAALCGKDACHRLKNNLGMRMDMESSIRTMQRSRRGA